MVFRHAYIAPTHCIGSPLALCSSKRMGVIAKEQISVASLPGDIVRIQFPTVRADTSKRFYYDAGQYMFVCVPTLGYLEWHPFTISSAPHEATVTIHIKTLGDWTRKLQKLVDAHSTTPSTGGTGAVPAPFTILFDGPYGSLSIDIVSPKTYSHFALFSGGIGITPMQAIVNQLYFEYHHQGRHSIKRVRFVWSVRDRATLQALFCRDAIESKRQQQVPSSMLSYLPDALLSASTGNNETRDVFFSEFFLTKGQREGENPVDQQLQHCLRYGTRPQIRDTLKSLGDDAKQSGKARVAVLVCGPSAMVKQVVGEAISLSREINIHFDVHAESFDF